MAKPNNKAYSKYFIITPDVNPKKNVFILLLTDKNPKHSCILCTSWSKLPLEYVTAYTESRKSIFNPLFYNQLAAVSDL